jgi:hypothetical protein
MRLACLTPLPPPRRRGGLGDLLLGGPLAASASRRPPASPLCPLPHRRALSVSPTTLELLAAQQLQQQQARRAARRSSASTDTLSAAAADAPGSPLMSPQGSLPLPPQLLESPQPLPLPLPLQLQRSGSALSQRTRASLDAASGWVRSALRRSGSLPSSGVGDAPAAAAAAGSASQRQLAQSPELGSSYVHRPGTSSMRLIADADLPWLAEPRMSLDGSCRAGGPGAVLPGAAAEAAGRGGSSGGGSGGGSSGGGSTVVQQQAPGARYLLQALDAGAAPARHELPQAPGPAPSGQAATAGAVARQATPGPPPPLPLPLPLQQQAPGLARGSFGFPASHRHLSPVQPHNQAAATGSLSAPQHHPHGELQAAAQSYYEGESVLGEGEEGEGGGWRFTPASQGGAPAGGLLGGSEGGEGDARGYSRSATPTLLLPPEPPSAVAPWMAAGVAAAAGSAQQQQPPRTPPAPPQRSAPIEIPRVQGAASRRQYSHF